MVPVFVFDPGGEAPWAPGGASRWWLHHSLEALGASLAARGSRLILARGETAAVLAGLARSTGADTVFWNRAYEPAAIARERTVAAALARVGVATRVSPGSLLFEPDAVANREGGPFQVFTPFWRTCLEREVAPPIKLPAGPLPAPAAWPRSLALADLALRPRHPWDAGFRSVWTPGEEGARRRLRQFVTRKMKAYVAAREEPGTDGTSDLSPHLHFGEVSPRQVWAAVRWVSAESGVFPDGPGAATFLKEVGWREFAHHLLWHFPHTPEAPLREKFARFPWAPDPGGRLLEAWRRGQTGYPIVDAGMRQLWATGWMHNRVRMVAASFLVKHLRLPWTAGAAWFWDTLVDADLASNTLGWQWSAGCGADAAPYFRIFAPVRQGERFDGKGTYVRRWVPELAALPDAHLHAPWEAPPAILAAAGVALGRNYPRPIVDHATARAAALAAFQTLR